MFYSYCLSDQSYLLVLPYTVFIREKMDYAFFATRLRGAAFEVLLAAVFRPVDLVAVLAVVPPWRAVRFVAVLLAVVRLLVPRLVAVLDAALRGALFAAVFFAAVFLAGTLAPRSLASDKPIAMACLREVTFLPLRPLLSLPSFISCMASFTFLSAPLE